MSSTIAKEITIPSKWDIIPLHTSDRATFKFCRRQWEWSSPAKRNLIRKVRIHGIIMPLWFGTGIHYALQKYYNPVLSEDPVKVFEDWFNTEWNGGYIHYNDLEQYADRDPVAVADSDTTTDIQTGATVPSMWFIKGLNQLLPDPDEELFYEHKTLGIGMLTFYKEYAQREDNFRVINVEHTFSVPIVDEDGQVLVRTDDRVMPDWWQADKSFQYGDYTVKEVHARGRMDAVIQDLDTGQYGIIDHKTASKVDDDYFRHLDLDEQCTTYLWAAEREAEIYDLEYKKVDFIIYQALRKNFPKPPTITNRGVPSIDRQKESPTAEMFMKAIKDNGLDMVMQTDERMQNYYTHLLEQGDKLFIQRGAPGMPYVTRNKHQRESAGRRLYYEAMDMLNDPATYPNPTKNYSCLNCVFRGPCIQKEDGGDYETVLSESYQENYDR